MPLIDTDFQYVIIWVAVVGDNKLVSARDKDHCINMCIKHFGVEPKGLFQIPYYLAYKTDERPNNGELLQ